MNASFRNMIMCHLIADTSEELLSMARRIGVNTKWIQYPGTVCEHFDIAQSKKRLAIAAGAIEITWRQAGAMQARFEERLPNLQGIFMITRDWKTVPYTLAECEACGLTWDGSGQKGRSARQTAIRHARKHNHKLRVEVTVIYIYQDSEKKES